MRKCPFCGGENLGLLETDLFACRDCGQRWRTPYEDYQQETIEPEAQGVVSRRISKGKISNQEEGLIYRTEQVDEEKNNGIATKVTRSFACSGAGYLVHQDGDVEAVCSQCKSIVHFKEISKCEYHSNLELLCGKCSHVFQGKAYCKTGYLVQIAIQPLKTSFSLSIGILKILFLKQKS